MTDTVLSLTDLSKSFGGLKAVSDVSFELAKGELLALIGPNGAGKTTCFNMLNGQLKADKGRVLLNGESILGLSPRRIWRKGVGRTFQITATYASMPVRENVQMALISHHRKTWDIWRPATGLYVDEAMDLLALVGMKEQAERAAAISATVLVLEFASRCRGALRSGCCRRGALLGAQSSRCCRGNAFSVG